MHTHKGSSEKQMIYSKGKRLDFKILDPSFTYC